MPRLPLTNFNNKKLLFILTGALGDLARALILAKLVKEKYPEVHIAWLVEKKWLRFVELSREIDQFIIFDRKASLRGAISLYRQLRSQEFDLSFDLQRILKSGLMSWLSGAKIRIGFHPQDCKEYNEYFNNYYIPALGNKISKQIHYFEFLKFLNINEAEFKPYLTVAASDVSNKFLTNVFNSKYLAIVLGSSWQSKDWPAEHYFELIRMLLQSVNLNIVLLADASKIELAESLCKKYNNERLINLANKTSLPELVACLNSAQLAFGPDSGPAHISAATGTPFVAVFGPTSIERTAPWNYCTLALSVPVDCGPCYKRICPGYGGICLKNITPKMVFDKILENLPATLLAKN